MSDLTQLPNIGKVLKQHLITSGISTPDELIAAGAKDAFMRIRLNADPGACLNMLYALQGAIEGIRHTHLSDDTKKDLKIFFNSL